MAYLVPALRLVPAPKEKPNNVGPVGRESPSMEAEHRSAPVGLPAPSVALMEIVPAPGLPTRHSFIFTLVILCDYWGVKD